MGSMLAALSKAFEEAELPRLTCSLEKLRVILGHSTQPGKVLPLRGNRGA